MDASLSSRPTKRGVSRFKSELQAGLAASGNTSISLGTSVLPQGKSHTLQKAVRIGKSENGKLVGGEEGESDSEHEENENVKRSLEMLRAGIVDDSSIKGTDSLETDEAPQCLTGRSSSTKSASLSVGPSEPKPGKTSRFLAERAVQKPPPERASEPSLLSDTVVGRPASKCTSPLLGNGKPRERDGPSANAASRKPPVVISVPSVPPSVSIDTAVTHVSCFEVWFTYILFLSRSPLGAIPSFRSATSSTRPCSSQFHDRRVAVIPTTKD